MTITRKGMIIGILFIAIGMVSQFLVFLLLPPVSPHFVRYPIFFTLGHVVAIIVLGLGIALALKAWKGKSGRNMLAEKSKPK